MNSAARLFIIAVVCAVFGFAGATAAIITFQGQLRGDRGPAGAAGEPGPVGPAGPAGPPGVGVDQLVGGYLLGDTVGDFYNPPCPPGTSATRQYGGPNDEVVLDHGNTAPLCRIEVE